MFIYTPWKFHTSPLKFLKDDPFLLKWSFDSRGLCRKLFLDGILLNLPGLPRNETKNFPIKRLVNPKGPKKTSKKPKAHDVAKGPGTHMNTKK